MPPIMTTPVVAPAKDWLMASFANSMWPETVLPARADVVVGGGIVGATAALYLSEKGLSIALADLVAGDAPIADPAPFRNARFAT
jgi:hypothetical protein